MTARFVSLIYLSFAVFSGSVATAKEDVPLPLGWDEMSEEKKQEYRDLYADFRDQLNDWRITENEKAALSAGEKKAHYQAMWELRKGFADELASKGFESKSFSEVAAEAAVKSEQKKSAEGAATEGATKSASASFVGSIVYDDGFPTIGFGDDDLIGAKFNTHTGNPVLASGTVSTVRALLVPGPANTTSSAGFVLLGPQTTMGGAFAIDSTFAVADGIVDSVSFTGLSGAYTGSSFYVLFGDFASVYVPVFGTGTRSGQGHHAVDGFTGGMGPDITSTSPLTGLNAFIRPSGNIFSTTPVELMKFEIESDSKDKAAE